MTKDKAQQKELENGITMKESSSTCCIIQGCVIECQNIPSTFDSEEFMAKILYMHPAPPDRNANPIFRCRTLVHETHIQELVLDKTKYCAWKSSFLWKLRGEALGRKIFLHGFAGDLLFSVYSIRKVTRQRHFVGQAKLRLNRTGRKTEFRKLMLRNGVTPTGATLKLEIELFLPKKLGSLNAPDDKSSNFLPERETLKNSHDNTAAQGFRRGSNDIPICEAVLERRRQSSQRQFKKRQNELMRENSNIQQRLREISIRQSNRRKA